MRVHLIRRSSASSILAIFITIYAFMNLLHLLTFIFYFNCVNADMINLSLVVADKRIYNQVSIELHYRQKCFFKLRVPIAVQFCNYSFESEVLTILVIHLNLSYVITLDTFFLEVIMIYHEKKRVKRSHEVRFEVYCTCILHILTISC